MHGRRTRVSNFAMASCGALAAALLSLAGGISAQPRPYDPLAVPARPGISTIDFTVTDPARRRDIPIRVYPPPRRRPRPSSSSATAWAGRARATRTSASTGPRGDTRVLDARDRWQKK